MTASGQKMGKTEKGALWLDPALTSPYDYYQYWINTDDRDVGRFLRFFTLLPLEEIAALERLEGADVRRAKERLAWEATALTHGKEEADRARDAARALFGGGGDDARSAQAAETPSFSVSRKELEDGVPAVNVFADSGLCPSRNAARRTARQNGLYVNGEAIDEARLLSTADLVDGGVLLRAGKKKYLRVVPR
jgi:tyrosyl-tRNA synthetase